MSSKTEWSLGLRVMSEAPASQTVLDHSVRLAQVTNPESQIVHFGEHEPLPLDCGDSLAPFSIAYQTYGTLNADRSNLVLVCHALTGDQHVANVHPVKLMRRSTPGGRAGSRSWRAASPSSELSLPGRAFRLASPAGAGPGRPGASGPGADRADGEVALGVLELRDRGAELGVEALDPVQRGGDVGDLLLDEVHLRPELGVLLLEHQFSQEEPSSVK